MVLALELKRESVLVLLSAGPEPDPDPDVSGLPRLALDTALGLWGRSTVDSGFEFEGGGRVEAGLGGVDV